MTAISSVATGSHAAASAIGVGKAVKWGGYHAAHRLVVEDRRDPESGFGDQVVLDGVDRLRKHLGRLVPDQAERGNMSNAVLEQDVELSVARPLSVEQRQRKDGGQLHCLFFDGHLSEQLLCAPLCCHHLSLCHPHLELGCGKSTGIWNLLFFLFHANLHSVFITYPTIRFFITGCLPGKTVPRTERPSI